MAEIPNSPVWETWESMLQKSTALGNKILSATLDGTVQPVDAIGVVPRGGLYMVNILSRKLALSGDQVVSMGISRYSREHPTQPGIFKIGQLPSRADVEGKHILLADEVLDTGETVQEAEKILHDLGASAISLAVIHYKPGQNVTGRVPEFYIEATNGWVHYPWEVIDDTGSVYKRAMSNGH